MLFVDEGGRTPFIEGGITPFVNKEGGCNSSTSEGGHCLLREGGVLQGRMLE